MERCRWRMSTLRSMVNIAMPSFQVNKRIMRAGNGGIVEKRALELAVDELWCS